jgi:hypothetical protein
MVILKEVGKSEVIVARYTVAGRGSDGLHRSSLLGFYHYI